MLIALAVLCTIIESLFTALEVALGAVSRARLRALAAPPSPEAENHDKEHNGNGANEATIRRAKRVLGLLEHPDRLTLLFLTVTTFSLWISASLLTWQAMADGWPLPVLALAMALVLFCAEVLPLLVAARRAEMIALYGASLVRQAQRILSPFLLVYGGLAYGMARIAGCGPDASPAVTEGELRTALATAEEEGVIEKEERAMLEGAMDFRDKVVREVMTPRIDMVGVAADTSLQDALKIALDSGHSRLPVFDKTLDRITGVAATKDFLPYLRANAEKTVGEIVRPAFFVPEKKPIATTLDELRKQRTLLAIVVDPDGGTAGLVTLEDLLEELVGEIQDEYDYEDPPIKVVETDGQPPVLVCEAGVTVRDLLKTLERDLHLNGRLREKDGEAMEASQSLSSVALELFESIPASGDCIAAGEASSNTSDVRVNFQLELEVSHMDGPRIEEVTIRLLPA